MTRSVPMPGRRSLDLSRRERQIMDSVFRRLQASVAEVRADLPNPPTYSAVRASMQVLVRKGYLRASRVGRKYIYVPTVARRTATDHALRRVVRTFFDNSIARAMTALLDLSSQKLSDEELDRLARLIEEVKRRA
jgi:predicted transcriptional regulator